MLLFNINKYLCLFILCYYLLFILILTLNLIFQISSVIASSSWFPGFFLIHPHSFRLNRHEYEQSPGESEGQGSLECYSPQGLKESDMTQQLNNNNIHGILNLWHNKVFQAHLIYIFFYLGLEVVVLSSAELAPKPSSMLTNALGYWYNATPKTIFVQRSLGIYLYMHTITFFRHTYTPYVYINIYI